jgi:hypothetical protein
LLLPDVCQYKTNLRDLGHGTKEDTMKALRALRKKQMGYLATFKKCNDLQFMLCGYVHSQLDSSQSSAISQLSIQNTISNPFSVVKEAADQNQLKGFKNDTEISCL